MKKMVSFISFRVEVIMMIRSGNPPPKAVGFRTHANREGFYL
jgi:hypothetical protein